MSVNLLDLFKNQLSGAAMKGISSMLGESESSTGTAMSGIAATLLGSLAGKASSPSGAASLLSDLGKADTGILSNITSILGSDKKSSLLDSGSKLVSSLLGGKANSVIDTISSIAGIGKGSSSSLLSMAAPLLMGFVGKYVKDKALDAAGLGKLLGSQKDYIKSAMPSSLFDSLGFSSLGGAAKDAAKGAASTVTNTVSQATDNKGGGGFLKPLLIALALLAMGYFGFKSCSGNETDQAKDHAKEMVKDDHHADEAINKLDDDHAGHDHADHQDNADTHTDNAETGDKADEVDAMDTKGLNFEKGTWAYTLSDFLANGTGSKTFTLDKVPFEGDEVSVEAKAQLDNLARILNAYPNLTAEVQGHTAKAKNAVGAKTKKAASRARAIWVMAKLKARGVDGKQLTSKGYGDEKLLSSIAEDADGQKRIMIKFDK